MRVVLLVNTTASSVTARGRVVIQKALSADHDLTVAETNRRGHATRLAQGAAADGVDAVIALGGDGTLNEVANGLAGTSTALGVLPGGSTNVFARTLGLANDPIEATGQLLDGMHRDARRRVGLGTVNGRYFLFHVGMGFDAAVVEQVERRSGLKRYAGHPLFVYAGLDTWFRHYDRKRPRFAIRHADGATVDGGWFAICLNTNPYTFLGNRPLNVAPAASLDTALSLVSFRSTGVVTLATMLAAALGDGRRIARNPRMHVRDGVSSFVVGGHGPFPYQVDGDHLGDTEELEFGFEPACLDLFVP